MINEIIPNFFVIGAQKAGTTSLYYYLKEHPQIFLTEKKELHFFSSDETLDFEEYLNHFKGSENYAFRGEISPSYLHVKSTAKRIHDFNPEAKIIVLLRDPVTRAYSNYIHRYRVGRESEGDFELALEKNKDSLKANNYMSKGLYTAQIEEYLKYFDSSNLLILIYEEFQADNATGLAQIQQFLGVRNEVLQVRDKHNTGTLPKHPILKPFFRLYSALLAPFLKSWVPKKLLKKIKAGLTVPTEKLSNEKRLELCNKYFRSDIDQLEKLLKMDFSRWYS